jgi:hypothetical protein
LITDNEIDKFLSQYDDEIFRRALKLRKVVIESLPHIIEQLDLSAKMIAYCYGQKYSELICVIIPSKKGLKLGFNRGAQLPDPDKLLKGTGKISRYVEINSDEQIGSPALRKLLASAVAMYKQIASVKK